MSTKTNNNVRTQSLMHCGLASIRPWLGALGLAACACGLAVPHAAYAELSNDGLLGAGLRWRPAYDGSDSLRAEAVPVIRYFGRPLFARSTQGVLEAGARFELAPGLNLGAQVAFEPGRNSGDADFLERRNVAGVNPGASLGAHLEWDHTFGPVPITLLARARRHSDSDRGTQVDFRLSAGAYRNGRFGAGVFTQATWASDKSTDSYYGITPTQSVATGLPVYRAGSGWLFGSVGLLWSVDLTRTWIVVGSMEARRLFGDAADSPIVERRSNYYLSAGLAYHF